MSNKSTTGHVTASMPVRQSKKIEAFYIKINKILA